MTMKWSFSCNSFVKFYVKKIGNHNMTALYPIPCYNEVCYEGTTLYWIYKPTHEILVLIPYVQKHLLNAMLTCQVVQKV